MVERSDERKQMKAKTKKQNKVYMALLWEGLVHRSKKLVCCSQRVVGLYERSAAANGPNVNNGRRRWCVCDGVMAMIHTNHIPKANACSIRCAQPYHRSSDHPRPLHHSHSHRPRRGRHPSDSTRLPPPRRILLLDICAFVHRSTHAASLNPIEKQ